MPGKSPLIPPVFPYQVRVRQARDRRGMKGRENTLTPFFISPLNLRSLLNIRLQRSGCRFDAAFDAGFPVAPAQLYFREEKDDDDGYGHENGADNENIIE